MEGETVAPDDELEPGPPIEECMAVELTEEAEEYLFIAAEIDR